MKAFLWPQTPAGSGPAQRFRLWLWSTFATDPLSCPGEGKASCSVYHHSLVYRLPFDYSFFNTTFFRGCQPRDQSFSRTPQVTKEGEDSSEVIWKRRAMCCKTQLRGSSVGDKLGICTWKGGGLLLGRGHPGPFPCHIHSSWTLFIESPIIN